jgi:hypothetical protein
MFALLRGFNRLNFRSIHEDATVALFILSQAPCQLLVPAAMEFERLTDGQVPEDCFHFHVALIYFGLRVIGTTSASNAFLTLDSRTLNQIMMSATLNPFAYLSRITLSMF